jgi:hypothetical protein
MKGCTINHVGEIPNVPEIVGIGFLEAVPQIDELDGRVAYAYYIL